MTPYNSGLQDGEIILVQACTHFMGTDLNTKRSSVMNEPVHRKLVSAVETDLSNRSVPSTGHLCSLCIVKTKNHPDVMYFHIDLMYFQEKRHRDGRTT